MQPLVASGPATVSTVTSWSDIGCGDDLPDLAADAAAALARVLDATASVDIDGPRADPLVRAWTEQFVTDVSSLGDDLRVAAATALGAALFPYVVAVWAADMDGRVNSAWAQLVGSAPSSARVAAEPELDAWPAVDEFLVAVSRLDHLDAVTTEVVRLRGARANNCRLCRSRRNVQAIEAGADEEMFDAIDRYESSDLAEPLKVALRVTDAVLWTPHAWPAGLAADVRRCFSPDQAVELVFDVVRNAANRIAVALGADEAHVADGVEYFAVDADGALTYGLPVPGTSETV